MKVGKKVRNKLFPVLLAVIMAFGMMPAAVYGADGDAAAGGAAQFSDMPDSWSTKALQNAVSNGLLGGDGGKIMPNQNLTRAQMAAVITRAFGAEIKGDIGKFTDVKPADWFADSLAKAYQMGVIQGSGSQMKPGSAITRQEVFVILARAFKLQPADKMNKPFNDAGKIAGWAKGEVYAFVNAGYIQGSNGKLSPTNLITRAEFAQIFDNILKQYINKAGEYTQVADGNIMINVPGVTLKNLKVNGDLIVGDGVGNGELTLDSVAVTGRMVVRGGGVNSIIIKGSSSVSDVVVARVDGEVSIKVQGDAKVEVVYVDDSSDDVSFEGTFGKIEVAAPEIVVKAVGATINNLSMAGEGAKVVVDNASKVTSATMQAPNIQITGTGNVTKVEVQAGANGSKIETPNTQISVGAGVTGVIGGGGTKVDPGTTTNNNSTGTGTTGPTAQPPGSGGHSGNPPTTPSVSVSDIEISGETTVTFNCSVGGATIKWNEIQLSGTTVAGKNTITVPAAAFGSVNSIEISKSGYTVYTNAAVIRQLVSSAAEFTNALATTASSIKLGADLALTTSTMAITRAVTIDGNGHSVNKTVAITADNVTIKNLKGTVTSQTVHGIPGIGSNVAYYVKAKGAVLDDVKVDGSNFPATAPSIGITGFDTAEFTVKNSSLSNLMTGIFAHNGYENNNQNVLTATGNTFANVFAGIGGTEKTTVTITGNNFISVKASGEGIGLGAGVAVNGAAEDKYVSYLEANNTFGYSSVGEAKVRDYRPTVSQVKNATNLTVTSLLDGWTFKIGSVGLSATVSGKDPCVYTITIPAEKALKEGVNYITASKPHYPDSTVTVNYEGTTISTTAELLDAIQNADSSSTICLSAGTYGLTGQLDINKAITLLGKGNVTIEPATTTWGALNTSKHLISIYSGTASNPVKFENITFDAKNTSCGIHAYGNAYGILKDVTIKNSKNAALIVNGSTVEAQYLNTSGNSWGSVNVDPGEGVKTPSVFTIDDSSVLTEYKQIWSDGKYVQKEDPAATVSVNAPSGYNQYKFQAKIDEVDTMWIKGLKNAAVLDGWIYLDIREAVKAATGMAKITPGAIITIMEGTYDIKDQPLEINGKIIVEGASKTETILKGWYPIVSSATVILNGGATLSNLTVTRDNSVWLEADNNNKSLVTLSNLTADTTLEDCIITHGRNGVYMNNSHSGGCRAIIQGNMITENRTGINFSGDCSDAEITGNDITDNSTVGIVTYSNANSDLGTITLTGNTITGNWLAQILIKYDNDLTAVPDNIKDAPTASQVKGTLVITDNTFEGTVTVAPCYNSEKAEPAYDAQRPDWGDGSDDKPSWTPPTVRIYNQPLADIKYGDQLKADLPVYDETQQ